MISPLLLAQAGAAGTDAKASTNAPSSLIPLDQGLLARFEQATGLPPVVITWGLNILASLLILIVGYFLAGFLRSLVKKVFARRHIDETVGDFVGNIAHAGIMTFVIVTALGSLGVDTKTFAAVIAAAGLAIGLALQGGLSNFAAGFLIVVFRPFKKGDVINGAGIEGVVEEVQIFSTTLHTADNKKIIVPNSSLIGGNITNYTANPTRRIDLSVAIGAGQSLSMAHAALLRIAAKDPRIVRDPAPAVANTKLVDGGTQIELRVWCKTDDFAALSSDLVAAAPEAMESAGIKGPDKTIFYTERRLG